jgi:hypothetical protein
MLNLKECRKLLGETGKKWTDKQIEGVRNYLTDLAKINISIIRQVLKNPKRVICNAVKDKNQNV